MVSRNDIQKKLDELEALLGALSGTTDDTMAAGKILQEIRGMLEQAHF